MSTFKSGLRSVSNNNFSNYSNNTNNMRYCTNSSSNDRTKWGLNQQYDLALPLMPTDLRMPFQIKWSPVDDILVIPSQDGNFRCWRVIEPQYYGKLRCQCVINSELLYKIYDMQFLPDGVGLFTADLDGYVRLLDLQTMKSYLIGQHAGGVNTISFHQGSSMAISLGQDRLMKFWDFRQPPMSPIYQLQSAAGIPMFADLKKNAYVHCTNANVIEIINLQILRMGRGNPIYAVFDSPTFHSVQNIKLSSNAAKIAITGAEGRVIIRTLNLGIPFEQKQMMAPTKNQKRNFQFRSHRQIMNKGKPNQEELINSINDISFNPSSPDILATCGGDGNIFLWNIEQQSAIFKCKPLQEPKTPVSNIQFNRNGNLLAFVVGDDGSRGSYPKDQWGQGQFVRNLIGMKKNTGSRQKPSSKYF